MSKQAFIQKKFSKSSKMTIATAEKIIVGYQEKGYRLTLRQLYYQFVSQDLIENTERSYKNLGAIISEARLAGLIDWDAIEDRVRTPKTPQDFDCIREAVDEMIYGYRLPRWRGQTNYVELWVEKDALAGVLWPIAGRFHITLMVNRGYSSQSAMFESAHRFRRNARDENYLLYLGDHDPSGEDMVRDIRDRLLMFEADVKVEKIALTMAQVREHNPPPNPAKMSDSRAQKYVDKHGGESWEVDALNPEILEKLISDRITALHDPALMDEVKAQEQKDKDAIRKAAIKL